ncbi:MAG: class I SAM-dependent methyltransferase [Acidimicrobiales bacterium]
MNRSEPVPPSLEELSFLAPPDEVCDWRMVVVHDAAAQAGLLARLAASPATPAELAADLGLDGHTVRVVLEELAVWDVVASDGAGRFAPGTGWPSHEASAALRHHARAIRAWSAGIDDRLRGVGPPPERKLPPWTDLWLEALAVRARHAAPAIVDACLTRYPEIRRALELGGGHGEYGLELARRQVEVTMVDRPGVIDIVRPRLEQADIVLHAGDFFEALPAGPFDLVLCAGVTHTYGAEGNRALFRRAATVLAPEGALAILTYLRGRDPMAPIFAVQMLMAASGADTHAEDDYRAWLGEAGFGKVEIADDAHPRESLLLATR